MEKLVVLLSTYNGEKYLKAQLDSILNQKLDIPFDLIVRDDGSVDSTKDILNDYLEKYKDKMRVVFGSNSGLNNSFFELIRIADNYDYYSISDQDDVWLEDKLQVAVNTLRNKDNSKPLLYASTCMLVKDDLKPYGLTRGQKRPLTIYNTLVQTICPGHSQVFNAPLRNILCSDFDISKVHMYDAWICNCAALFGEILFDNNPHDYYRQHQDNQLGSGKSSLGKLLSSFKKVKKGHGSLIMVETKYFNNLYKDKMIEIGAFGHIEKYTNAKNFFSRMGYAFRGKLYRQSRVETFAFYLAYIFGFYKCKN